MNWNWSKRKTQNYFLCHWTGKRFFLFIFNTKQNKTFLLWNENKNKSEIKAEVKLICSRPRTAIQNRKRKISMLIAGNCHSKQKRPEINMFMAGNFRSKKKKTTVSRQKSQVSLFLFWTAVLGHEHINFTFSVLNGSYRPWTY